MNNELCRLAGAPCNSHVACSHLPGPSNFLVLHRTNNSDFRRLTFLKETTRSPEQLCVTTGNLYHSLWQ